MNPDHGTRNRARTTLPRGSNRNDWLEPGRALADECEEPLPACISSAAQKDWDETPVNPNNYGGEAENHALPGNLIWGPVPTGDAPLQAGEQEP